MPESAGRVCGIPFGSISSGDLTAQGYVGLGVEDCLRPLVVAANLVVRTGSDANPTTLPGLASFTVAMLDQGTATRSATQIAIDAAASIIEKLSGASVDKDRLVAEYRNVKSS